MINPKTSNLNNGGSMTVVEGCRICRKCVLL